MTDKQKIISLLIKDYEEAIEKCNEIKRVIKMQEYLDSIHLDAGVCYALSRKHGIYKKDFVWIKRHLKGMFWCDTPVRLFSKKSIIESLQYRLKILKQEFEIED